MNNMPFRKSGEFDLENLPPGIYHFTGDEGVVTVEVDTNKNQHWDLENWFASLDPDQQQVANPETIRSIKRRINLNTGIIEAKKTKKGNFLINLFKRKLI